MVRRPAHRGVAMVLIASIPMLVVGLWAFGRFALGVADVTVCPPS